MFKQFERNGSKPSETLQSGFPEPEFEPPLKRLQSQKRGPAPLRHGGMRGPRTQEFDSKDARGFPTLPTRLQAMQGPFGAWKVLKSRAPGTYLQKDLVDPRLDGSVERSQAALALLAVAVLATNDRLRQRLDVGSAGAAGATERPAQQDLVHAGLHSIVVGTQSRATRVPISVVAPDHRLRERLDVRAGRVAAGRPLRTAAEQNPVHLGLHLVVPAAQGGTPRIAVPELSRDDALRNICCF